MLDDPIFLEVEAKNPISGIVLDQESPMMGTNPEIVLNEILEQILIHITTRTRFKSVLLIVTTKMNNPPEIAKIAITMKPWKKMWIRIVI